MKKDMLTTILLLSVLILCIGIAIVLATDTGEDDHEDETHTHDEYVEIAGDTMTGDLAVPNLETSGTISGDGSALINLNADNIETGTIDSARLPSIDAATLDGLDSTAFALASHDHNILYYTKLESDNRYAQLNHSHPPGDATTLDGYDSTSFALSTHNHSAIYYTKTESNSLYAPLSHNHDTLYYQKSEIDANFLNLNGGVLTGDLYLTNLYASAIVSGDGSALSDLNASAITTGTLDIARLPPSIDAATLDGYDSTYFALAVHSHDATYYPRSDVDMYFLNLSGGTLGGDLYLPNLFAVGLISGHGGGLMDLNASRIANGTLDIARLPANINADTLDGLDSTDLVLATDFSAHAANPSAHHTRYTDLEAQNAADDITMWGHSTVVTDLNADRLDNFNAVDFAQSFHTHDASDITGGTLVVDGLNVDTGTLYVDSGNNRLGIGTTSPNEELEIYMDQDDWTNIRLNNPNAGTNAGNAIYFYEGAAERAYIAAANSGNTASASGANSLRIQTSNGPITIHSNSNDDVIIQENAGPGNVGIGTTGPTDKLHVVGNARVQGNMFVQGNMQINGKATVMGGVDPPYVSFSNETHDSIRLFAGEVHEHEKVMIFWNGETERMELYVIGEDNFYTFTGDLIVE